LEEHGDSGEEGLTAFRAQRQQKLEGWMAEVVKFFDPATELPLDGLGRIVSYPFTTRKEDRAAEYAHMSIFLMPSSSQSVVLVLSEAMACGRALDSLLRDDGLRRRVAAARRRPVHNLKWAGAGTRLGLLGLWLLRTSPGDRSSLLFRSSLL
jgi:hypothetical protein